MARLVVVFLGIFLISRGLVTGTIYEASEDSSEESEEDGQKLVGKLEYLMMEEGCNAEFTCKVDRADGHAYALLWSHLLQSDRSNQWQKIFRYDPRHGNHGKYSTMRDFMVLKSEPRYQVIKAQEYSLGWDLWTLKIENVTERDGGLYMCKLLAIITGRIDTLYGRLTVMKRGVAGDHTRCSSEAIRIVDAPQTHEEMTSNEGRSAQEFGCHHVDLRVQEGWAAEFRCAVEVTEGHPYSLSWLAHSNGEWQKLYGYDPKCGERIVDSSNPEKYAVIVGRRGSDAFRDEWMFRIDSVTKDDSGNYKFQVVDQETGQGQTLDATLSVMKYEESGVRRGYVGEMREGSFVRKYLPECGDTTGGSSSWSSGSDRVLYFNVLVPAVLCCILVYRANSSIK